MPPQEDPFNEIERKCAAYAQHLQLHLPVLRRILSVYQSHATTLDEIARSVECLLSISEIREHLTRRTKRVCTFFPLNLPVYSLVLFAVIPSFMADEVYLRPPQKMIPVFREQIPALKTLEFFPISMSDLTRGKSLLLIALPLQTSSSSRARRAMPVGCWHKRRKTVSFSSMAGAATQLSLLQTLTLK